MIAPTALDVIRQQRADQLAAVTAVHEQAEAHRVAADGETDKDRRGRGNRIAAMYDLSATRVGGS